HYAVIMRRYEAAELLIARGARVNETFRAGSTALHVAAGRGYLNFIELLVKGGANVNAGDDNGLTPLMEAAWRGDTAAVRYLLNHGASIAPKTKDSGSNALHLAATKGQMEVVLALLSAGANPNEKDGIGATALDNALSQRQSAVAGILIDRGA